MGMLASDKAHIWPVVKRCVTDTMQNEPRILTNTGCYPHKLLSTLVLLELACLSQLVA